MIESLDKGKVWAEVGTFEGAFARRILDACQPSELQVIDLDFSLVKKAGNIAETDSVKFCKSDSATCLKEFPDATLITSILTLATISSQSPET